jgi:hypothetical protein
MEWRIYHKISAAYPLVIPVNATNTHRELSGLPFHVAELVTDTGACVATTAVVGVDVGTGIEVDVDPVVYARTYDMSK